MNTLWTPSLQQAATSASAMLLTAIGLIALLQRGQWLITLLFSSSFLALGALQAGALGLLRSTTPGGAHVWADYLARVSALSSWLWLALSVLLGRPEPQRQLREAGAPLAASLVTCVLLFVLARSSMVLDSVVLTPDGPVIQLGPLGKAYLGYLAVSMLLVLLNMEGMLRAAPASSQRRLGGLFLSILVAVLTELLVVSAGVLQGRVHASWLAAASPLLFGSGSAAALALARRRLRDMSVPVGRPVTLKGIAFDGGYGIQEVQISVDGGATWRRTDLGGDLGRYSCREWSSSWAPSQAGPARVMVRAFNRIGESQGREPLWNPAGYLRNVIEHVDLQVG